MDFISQERFEEALAVIVRQPPEIRAWTGLAALEAGLVSAKDPQKSLDLYYKVINGKVRDRHWARALAGYRTILGRLSSAGDYGARAKLIRSLGSEWRNNEARAILESTLKEEGLPEDLRNELRAFGAVLALRTGDFQAAAAFWEGRKDQASIMWLSTLNLRLGKFETAAEGRLGLSRRLKGRSRLRELQRTLDILLKGGLTLQAEELLAKNQDLSKSSADKNFRLALCALIDNQPEKALGYLALEEKRKGANLAATYYYQARATELTGEKEAAKELYRKAAATSLGYYRLLAEGRLAALGGSFKKLALAEPMAALLYSPLGPEHESLGWFMWVSERLPYPWVQWPREIPKEQLSDSRPIPRARAAVDYYLRAGDEPQALAELAAAGPEALPAKIGPADPMAARYALLAARGGSYGLAMNLLGRIRTASDFTGQRWNHPLVLGRPVLTAWRRHGLSPQLTLSVIRTESLFQAEAVSRSNARGLMQILPSTAQRLAVYEGDPPPREEDLFDPDLNVRYGAAYLSELVRVYGSVPLALASYNGGPFNIKAYMEAVPQRPADLFIETLPFSESSNYVKRVLESQARYEAAYLGRYNYHDLTAPVGKPLFEPPDF
ncbi:MAG: lytic transglycosylase domain-containing protein [Deltaproteobacteria bacterium]|nr:lytic transglycosylase domain-containing protein [Deltaproteobacteria bacterium]